MTKIEIGRIIGGVNIRIGIACNGVKKGYVKKRFRKFTYTLCSRNFQNVKLWLEFVDI